LREKVAKLKLVYYCRQKPDFMKEKSSGGLKYENSTLGYKFLRNVKYWI